LNKLKKKNVELKVLSGMEILLMLENSLKIMDKQENSQQGMDFLFGVQKL
jgi:hypothetical protein